MGVTMGYNYSVEFFNVDMERRREWWIHDWNRKQAGREGICWLEEDTYCRWSSIIHLRWNLRGISLDVATYTCNRRANLTARASGVVYVSREGEDRTPPTNLWKSDFFICHLALESSASSTCFYWFIWFPTTSLCETSMAGDALIRWLWTWNTSHQNSTSRCNYINDLDSIVLCIFYFDSYITSEVLKER